MNPHTKIDLLCYPGAYSGDEIANLCPPFMTDYKVTVGYRWSPAADGVESWSLLVQILAGAGAVVGTVFLKKLTEDIYGWAKSKIVPTVNEKAHSVGTVIYKFEDASLIFWISPPAEEMLTIIEEIPVLLEDLDSGLTDDWGVSVSEGKPKLEPFYKAVRMKFQSLPESDQDAATRQAISDWKEQKKH